MDKQEKTYKIQLLGRRNQIYEGTLEELKKKFSYTFEIGYSWNKKINTNPKTIKSFISNLQKAYSTKEACIYSRTFVELIEEKEKEC
jgi:hypothetical protein